MCCSPRLEIPRYGWNDESGDCKFSAECKKLETLGKWTEIRYNARHDQEESGVTERVSSRVNGRTADGGK